METNSITDYLQSLHDIIPAIQMGLFPDPSIGQVYHKFAESNHITTTATIVSACQNQNPFNTAGTQLYISSASALDAQVIYLEGVDQDFNITSETIQLQGQTAVPLTVTFRTIIRGYNANSVVLNGDVYVGTESLPLLGTPLAINQYARIPASYNGKQANQTLTSIFTVPLGYTGFLTNWYTTASKGKDLDMIAYARLFGKVFRYQERLAVFETSSQKTLPWLKFPEKSDLKVEALTSNGTIDGSVSYDLVLLRNDFIEKFKPLAWR